MLGSAVFRTGVAPGGVLAGPWVRNELWNRARAVPSLDLRFADNKSLVDATTGQNLISFTRASSGTYVDSQGVIRTATTNEARFDHNPITGESLGLLMEESRTNLCTYSEAFDDASWVKTSLNGTITANQATAPDGLNTADLYQEDANTLGRFVGKTLSATSGTSYTAVFWAKQAPGATRYAGLVLPAVNFGVNVIASYTLSGAGSVTISASGTGTSASIQQFPNGWYRCSLTSQATVTTSGNVQFRLSNSAANGSATYAGDGSSGLYFWGAQIEVGTFPTSYIPTTTATATRSADVASISGSNFSSWYRQDEGTVFVDFTGTNITSGQFPRLTEFNDGTSNNVIRLQQYSSGAVRASVTTGGAGQFAADNGAVAAGVRGKIAFGSALNDAALVTGGILPTTDTSYLVPTGLSQLGIGGPPGASTSVFNSTIRRLAFWPQRLSNSTLSAITQ